MEYQPPFCLALSRVRDKIWEGGPPLGGWGLISKPAEKIGRKPSFFKRLFAES